MSFYLDDNVEYDRPSQGARRGARKDDTKDDPEFVCLNCGGTDSYYEDVSGALCCASCFTQSQAMTAESTELDIQEIQALAGRTRKGLILPASYYRKTGTGLPAHQKRKPLEDYDTSEPFPNLVTCLNGMQQVMKRCIVCLCDVAGLDDDQRRTAVEATVRSLWKSYLRAWSDATEFYGGLHPEIRFSLRDCFLMPTHRAQIVRHLSYKISREVAEEMEDNSSVSSDEAEAEKAFAPPPEAGLGKIAKTRMKHAMRNYRRAEGLMLTYWDRGDRGRLECALVLKPSMRLVACMLWMASSRTGVTIQHVLGWIANGALPLQNAYKHCLSEQEQHALKLASRAFRMDKLPTCFGLESVACKLSVACGLKSFGHLHNLPKKEAESPDTSVAGETTKTRTPEGSRPDFSFVSPEAVPFMIDRFVRDLGFGKRIFDFALALMGIPPKVPQNAWLPAPLDRARPENLWSPAHVLAVIAVAYRMVPGWETRSYPRPSVESNLTTAKSTKGDGEKREAARLIAFSKRDRHIPYNDLHARLLENGTSFENYIDFLEEEVFDMEEEPIFPELAAMLEATKPNGKKPPSEDAPSPAVLPSPILFAARNPNQPRKMWRKQKLHDWYMRLGNSRARWADANALGDYVVYTDRKSHATWTPAATPYVHLPLQPTPEPFHPHYGTLIEYMSYKTNVKPSKIHVVVAELDEEVLELVQKREQKRYTKRRRRVYQKRETTLASTVPMPIPSVTDGNNTLFDGVEFENSVAV